MGAGRKAKPRPSCIEELLGDKSRFRCTLCDQDFRRDGLGDHLKTMKHRKAVEAHEATQREDLEVESRAAVLEKSLEIAFTRLERGQGEQTVVKDTTQSMFKHVRSAQENALWNDFLQNGAEFAMEEEREGDIQRELEEKIDVFGAWDAERAAGDLGFHFGEEKSSTPTERTSASKPDLLGLFASPEEDAFLTDLLANSDLNGPDASFPELVGACMDDSRGTRLDWKGEISPDSPTYPYPNYPTFLLDVLDNIMPRNRIPDSLMRLFIFILKACGVKGCPSFYGLRLVQKQIREMCGIPMIPCRSVQGNVFFMLDFRTILAKDWSNRSVRPHMYIYPEILEDGSISEVWHADKMHSKADLSTLSPMYDAGDKHYYVNEIASTASDDWIVPFRWVIFRQEVHADAYIVSFDDEGFASINNTQKRLFAARLLQSNLFDLEATGRLPQWASSGSAPALEGNTPNTPNPLRKIAGGEPLYSSFVNHFVDDVSGNHSKSWNKHWNTYMTHANLPRKLLQQETHVHFVSTSPNASAAEQFYDFKRVIESTHVKPVRVRDGITGKPIRFRVFVNAEPSDNPMQSECSGHIGGNGNLYCRKCMAGGTTVSKETDVGYHALFEPGQPRSKDGVLGELQKQVKEACSGVESRVKKRQTETGVKDAYTQFWISDLISRAQDMKKAHPERSEAQVQSELMQWVEENHERIYNPFLMLKGLDPTQDTPIEVLHTILLGVVKYAWHWTHTSWSATQKTTYAQRLQATNTNALSVNAIRANYIMQFANSLIGRQFKIVAQATAFHVYDLLSPPMLQLWLSIGEMTALIWFPVIKDKTTYKADLLIAIANVLDTFAEIDPSKQLEKIKLHVLSHSVEDVDRFGPLIGMCTEAFESFNAVFRNCSIQSNHQAPSRDIAEQLGDQESLLHRLTGGFWPSPSDGSWVQAGWRVRDFLQEHSVIARLAGHAALDPPRPGSFTLTSVPDGEKARPTSTLRKTCSAAPLNAAMYSLDTERNLCRNLISQAEDECSLGSWICAPSPLDDSTNVLGQVTSILANPEDSFALVVLEVYEVSATRHHIFQMPVLTWRYGEASYVIIRSTDVKFAFNVQHDCVAGQCAASGQRPSQQERIESGVTEKFIEHTDFARYIINMHALHHPHLIRSVLPRSLIKPIPRFKDRRAEHAQMAEMLRKRRKVKETATQVRKKGAGKAAPPNPQGNKGSSSKEGGNGAEIMDVDGTGGQESLTERNDIQTPPSDSLRAEGRKRRRVESE